MSVTISDLLSQMKEDCLQPSFPDELLVKYAQEIANIYEDKHHNIRSSIAQCISEYGVLDAADMFAVLLEHILEVIDKTPSLHKCRHSVEYFYDYFSLECFHLEQQSRAQNEIIRIIEQHSRELQNEIHTKTFEATKDMQATSSRTTTRINGLVKRAEDRMFEALSQERENFNNKIDDRMNSLDIHSITVLGIFTAITFVFSGGFTLIGSALSSLTLITPCTSLLLISVLCLLGVVIFDCICCIIWGLSKFLNKAIPAKHAKRAANMVNIVLLSMFLLTFAGYLLGSCKSATPTSISVTQSATPNAPAISIIHQYNPSFDIL